MNRFKNILLVSDLEESGEATVSVALSLAKRNQSKLTLISVVEDPPPEMRMSDTGRSIDGLFETVLEDRREQQQALVQSIGAAGLDARARLASGTPFLEVIRQVLRDRHDLVIAAAEGTDGLRARLFGSTTMHLMRKCPCPVWVIKPTSQRRFARILAAVDPSSPDEEDDSLDRLVMDLATSLAHLESGELHVIHAWNLPGEQWIRSRAAITPRELDTWLEEVRAGREKRINDLLGHYSSLGLDPRLHLVKGRAGEEIPEMVRRQEIDLLVMGTLCRTGVAGFFIGNTAETVLADVRCSVLTVKPQGFVTPVTLEDQ